MAEPTTPAELVRDPHWVDARTGGAPDDDTQWVLDENADGVTEPQAWPIPDPEPEV